MQAMPTSLSRPCGPAPTINSVASLSRPRDKRPSQRLAGTPRQRSNPSRSAIRRGRTSQRPGRIGMHRCVLFRSVVKRNWRWGKISSRRKRNSDALRACRPLPCSPPCTGRCPIRLIRQRYALRCLRPRDRTTHLRGVLRQRLSTPRLQSSASQSGVWMFTRNFRQRPPVMSPEGGPPRCPHYRSTSISDSAEREGGEQFSRHRNSNGCVATNAHARSRPGRR
jgi:hypothetical protein